MLALLKPIPVAVIIRPGDDPPCFLARPLRREITLAGNKLFRLPSHCKTLQARVHSFLVRRQHQPIVHDPIRIELAALCAQDGSNYFCHLGVYFVARWHWQSPELTGGTWQPRHQFIPRDRPMRRAQNNIGRAFHEKLRHSLPAGVLRRLLFCLAFPSAFSLQPSALEKEFGNWKLHTHLLLGLLLAPHQVADRANHWAAKVFRTSGCGVVESDAPLDVRLAVTIYILLDL